MFLAKFGQTVYQDRETIGTGNDEIQGYITAFKSRLQTVFTDRRRLKFYKRDLFIPDESFISRYDF